MLGFAPISAVPISALSVPELDNDVPFEDLRDNPAIERVYLIEIDAPAAAGGGSSLASSSALASSSGLASGYGLSGGTASIRLSTHGYHSDDTIFLPTIKKPLNFSTQLFDSAKLTGRSNFGAGDIDILNGDGRLDDILSVAWDNAPISVKVGGKDFAYADFTEVFRALVESATWDPSRITLRIRDRQALFDEPLQSNRYGGTGGLDGGADLTGKPIPKLWGKKLNFEPVLVDSSSLIYQVNDGPMTAIDAVYFAGLAATLGVDYTLDLVNGRFTLLTAPGGIVTCDARGDNTGGYVDATTDIIKRILIDHAGFSEADDMDLGSFALAKALNSAVIGYYTGAEETTINTVLDDLMTGIGGFWGFNRYDRLFVGIAREPGTPEITYTSDRVISIKRVATPSPVWRTTTAYQRIGRVMTESEIAGAVSDARRAFLQQVVRLTESEDSAVKSLHPLARTSDVRSHYDSMSDSTNETDRLQTLHGTDRDYYEADIKYITYREELGMRVQLQYPRFGMTAGRNFIITGMNENHARDRITLTLWG